MYRLIFGSLMLVAAASPAGAMMASSDTKDSALDIKAPFAEQRKVIEAKLADGKTYAEISPGDRATVRESLSRISANLERSGSVEALSPELRTRVFNDQEMVNNILTTAGKDSRVVCERIQKVGSHRMTTSCATVADRRRASEASRETLRKAQSATPTLGGG